MAGHSDAVGRGEQRSDVNAEGRVLGIYHVNINVHDIERSREFYEKLGFQVVDSFNERDNEAIARGLGLGHGSTSNTRALFMKVGDNKHATVIDVCEWIEPKSYGEPIGINQYGIPRICLRAKNLDALVRSLREKGVTFITEEPQCIDSLDRSPRFICCKDPDGVLIEFVEL